MFTSYYVVIRAIKVKNQNSAKKIKLKQKYNEGNFTNDRFKFNKILTNKQIYDKLLIIKIPMVKNQFKSKIQK